MPALRRLTARRTTFTALAILAVLSIGTGGLTGISSAATDATPPAAPPSSGEQQASADVALDCPFAAPAGPQRITLKTTATLPATATVGSAVKFRSLTASFTLPRTVATQLAPAPATSLRGGLTLDLTAHQGDKSTAIPAPFTIAPTPLPENGDIQFTATADLPDQAITVPGEVTFDVGAPAIALKPVPEATSETTPVRCTLAPNQKTTLASILVAPAPAKPSTGNPDTPPPAARRDEAAPQDSGGFTIVTPLNLVQIVANSSIYRVGATVTSKPTGLLNGVWTIVLDDNGIQHDPSTITGSVGFKPVTATFLGFGFVPVSATVEFLPADYHNAKLIELNAQLSAPPGDTILTTHVKVMARMSNATVNGVPLDLGPDCVSASPISLNLFGPYNALQGGTVGTDPNAPDPDYRGFTLPPFVHCGVAEPLNALLTGMASTTTNINQAKVVAVNFGECTKPNHTQCPPPPTPPGSTPKPSTAPNTGRTLNTGTETTPPTPGSTTNHPATAGSPSPQPN
ncbi:DUF6801 domain-containing protein [Amycolatopsis sp. NPDC059090]|uniref:DUF6801 domain-containing protein n=1 Tax=unclassified Amycolatopsis TaxID=2618356 RepID=UPI00366C50F1